MFYFYFNCLLCLWFFYSVHCQCSNACFNFYQFKPRGQIERKKGFYRSEERQFNINLRTSKANEQKEIALERSTRVRVGTRGVQGCPLHKSEFGWAKTVQISFYQQDSNVYVRKTITTWRWNLFHFLPVIVLQVILSNKDII